MPCGVATREDAAHKQQSHHTVRGLCSRLGALQADSCFTRRSIAENIGRVLPGLETLVLTNNQFTTLKELEPLAGLPTLVSLSLMDNLVTKQQNYRAFVIALLPNLRLLDYNKVRNAAVGPCTPVATTGDRSAQVKESERKSAVALYSGKTSAQAPVAVEPSTFEPGEESVAAAPKVALRCTHLELRS